MRPTRPRQDRLDRITGDAGAAWRRGALATWASTAQARWGARRDAFYRTAWEVQAALAKMDTRLKKRPKPQLREQLFREGVDGLSDSQLLTLVLGTGSRGTPVEHTSCALLQSAGSLARLAKHPAEALAIAGVGPAKAARVLAALELGRRAASERPHLSFVENEQDVASWATPMLVGLEHEELWMLSLDARSRLKATTKLAQGGMHGCALTPQDVLRPAVRNAASGIVLVHNHPSGDPTPSPSDLQMTRTLAEACDLVGITLLDHVVVARDGCRSIAATLSASG